jgi:Gpi18-like mannosyltransferase
MPRSRRNLCIAYAAVALLALIGTWSQNVAYFRTEDGWLLGFVLATGRFWVETLATPASTSITVDLGLLLLPLCALMIIEARRLGIRFVWLYIVLGLLVAISVTFPLFLIAREQRLAARGEASEEVGIGGADAVGLLVLGAAMVAFTLWTVAR